MPTVRISYLLPAVLEDVATAELWAAGTAGLEVKDGGQGRVRIDAYFAGEPTGPDPIAAWPEVERLGSEPVEERDWLAEYRSRSRPFALGRRFWVDPGEPDGAALAAPDGRWPLRLPARTAFGTGSHESTRLAVELLEDAPVADRTVLDVGTGTGVLAFAALRLGARSATAFDVDPAAPLYARSASALNGLRPRLFVGEVAALSAGARFDLALVNVIPEQILPSMAAIAERVGGAGGGELILSGILEDRGPGVLDRARALGFAERARRTAGEWVAFRVGRNGRDGRTGRNGRDGRDGQAVRAHGGGG